jgi:hypothetical protein
MKATVAMLVFPDLELRSRSPAEHVRNSPVDNGHRNSTSSNLLRSAYGRAARRRMSGKTRHALVWKDRDPIDAAIPI